MSIPVVYAATARCPICDAGLAYREDADPYNGAWRCSLEIFGEAEHIPVLMPFRWIIVIPEDIPSARGETTRPQAIVQSQSDVI